MIIDGMIKNHLLELNYILFLMETEVVVVAIQILLAEFLVMQFQELRRKPDSHPTAIDNDQCQWR